MTTFNTDYSNTELLDQELTIEQLEAVAGGVDPFSIILAVSVFSWAFGQIEKNK